MRTPETAWRNHKRDSHHYRTIALVAGVTFLAILFADHFFPPLVDVLAFVGLLSVTIGVAVATRSENPKE